MKKPNQPTGLSTDAEIIKKVLDGEVALFEILMRRHNAMLYKIARGHGFNHQDAEDLLQETYVSAYAELNSIVHRASFKTWVTKILINKCLYNMGTGYVKKEQPHSELIIETAEPMHTEKRQPDNEILKREFANVLANSLQAIPISYRAVFILRELEGFNVAETAELLNITPTNVKVRLNRG
ncbi:MAG: sigma-70 family RNA polymerase sigma factor [Chitinophagaceae bacterium]|nr:sigma-70 family RNA polymerase sigma factor [Chitinophagaceae bacterium]